MDDSHIKLLAFQISKLSQLQSLALSFQRSVAITQEGIKYLVPIFKSLSSLSDLTITFTHLQGISPSASQEFFSSLNALKSLKKLNLSMLPTLNKDDPISSGLEVFDPHLLQEISIKFYIRFNDTNLIKLSQKLTQFSSLKSLNIDFQEANIISDQGLTQFGATLQNMDSLTSLKLTLKRHPNLNQAFEIISQSLSNLTKLKALSLNFPNNSESAVKTKSMHNLSSSLQQLHSLKNFSLTAWVCHSIDDQGIVLLIEGLKNVVNLQLDLSHNKELTNQGVKNLIEGLSACSFLNDLKLTFHGNTVTAEALEVIARGLQHIPTLGSLELAFVSTDNQTKENEGIEFLLNAINGLSSLRKVHLHMRNLEVVEKRIGLMKHGKTITTSG